MNRVAFEYVFLGGVMPEAVENMASGYGIVHARPAPTAGSIVAIVIQSDKPVIAGTITAVPTIEGVPTIGDLAATVTSELDIACKDIPEDTPGYTFDVRNKLGIQLTADEDWDNDNGNLIAQLYVALGI